MPSAVLEVKNLSKRFGGLTAVSNLDFEVREGEILGVIGPNGAGKSTTFNMIAGVYGADAGSIRFGGEPIGGLAPHEIAARGILRTFQHNRPFAGMSVVAISSDDVEGLRQSIENYNDSASPLPLLLADNTLETFKAYRCFDDFENVPLHGTFFIDAKGRLRWWDIGADPFMDVQFVLDEAKRQLALGQ